MSLSLGLAAARTSLITTGDQTSVISRNIANADRAHYSRKSVEVITIPGSGVRVSGVTRAEEPALMRSLLNANAQSNGQAAIVDALDRLNSTINDVELDSSPAALITKFQAALQSYSAQPDSKLAGEGAVRAAQNLAIGLNNAALTVEEVRREADAGINSAVERVNTLLQQFDDLNTRIVNGTRAADDVTDYMDERDAVIRQISEFIGIRTATRTDNDIAIYTDSGVTVFDRSARPIEFQSSASLTPGVAGNAVVIDGVPVTGANATMPLQSGRITGLAQVRDDISISYGQQLDEVARALITTFAEEDQFSPGSFATGLFSYSGSPTVPASGVVINGLAGEISIAALVNPDVGGDVTLLRDGGINDPGGNTYVYNTTGAASFSDRLDSLYVLMGQTQTFDGTAKLTTSATLSDYSSSSVAWLQELRKVANDEYEYRNTLFQRSSESHLKLTGVSLDEEMSMLLELERTYQTSAKLVQVIDTMFDALVTALR